MSELPVPTMCWRVCIRKHVCYIYAFKAGDIAIYRQDYSFRIWPWTDVEKKLVAFKKRMTWECAITLKESNTK